MTTFYARYPSSSGIQSINNDTTSAQIIAAGSGISVSTSSGTTTISSSGAASAVTSLTGDVTGTGPGATATTISNGVITNAKVASGAAIAINKLAAITASRAVVSDGSGILVPSTTTSSEIGFLSGVSSSIQTQFNNNRVAITNVSISSDTTLTDRATNLVDTSAARSLTLPVPAATSYIVIQDITGSESTNNITINPHGSEKIQGVASAYLLTRDFGSATLVSDGTDWYILTPSDREFAWNSSTDDANNTTSFGYGPAGNTFINVTAQRLKTVQFKNPITTNSFITVQNSEDGGNTWIPLGQWGGVSTYLNFGGIGIGISWIHGTSSQIIIGFERYRLPGVTYSGAGTDWSGIAANSTYRWRVMKMG